MTNLPHFPVSVFRDAGFILPVRAASKMKPERVRCFPLFPVMGPAASSGAAKRRFLQRSPSRFLFSARRTDGCATAMHPSGTGIQSPDTGRHNVFPFPPVLSFFFVCSGTPVPPRHGAIRHNPVSCHAPQRRSCPIFPSGDLPAPRLFSANTLTPWKIPHNRKAHRFPATVP